MNRTRPRIRPGWIAARLGTLVLLAGGAPVPPAPAAVSAADSLLLAAELDSLAVARLGDWSPAEVAEAESLLLVALQLRERVLGPEALEVATSLDLLATLRFNVADYEGALPYRERCLRIRLRHLAPDDPVVGAAQRDLGANRAALGQYVEARTLLEAARICLARTSPRDEGSFINLLTSLGELRRIENRYAEAESCLAEAVRLSRAALPGDPFVVYPMNNLAGVYKDQGRFDEAEILLRESLRIRERMDPIDPETLANATLNLAELLRLQKRFPEAETLYVEALAVARGGLGPDNPRLVWFLNQYAVLHRDCGRWPEAARLFQESRDILEGAGGEDPVLSQVLLDLGELLRLEGEPGEAAPHVQRAVTLREAALGPDHPEVAIALILLARCRLAADPDTDQADRLLDRVTRILDGAPAYPEARAEAHTVRSDWRWRRGDRNGAMAELAGALEILDGLRARRGGEEARAGFLGGYTPHYERMATWCLDAGDTARAFEVCERSRARVFLDQLAAARADPEALVPGEIRAPLEARAGEARLRIGACQDQIALLLARDDLEDDERRRRVEELTRERDREVLALEGAQGELRRASPTWREIATTSGRPISLAEVGREVAPPEGLVLVFELGSEASWVFALPPGADGIAVWPLVLDTSAAAVLETEPGPLRAPLIDGIVRDLHLGSRPAGTRERGVPVDPGGESAPASDAVFRRLHALWSVLVPPSLRPRVLAASEVVVVPDAGLHGLPFEALVLEEPVGTDPVYWLDRGPVVRYAASATSLAGLERRRGAEAGEPAEVDTHSDTEGAAPPGSPSVLSVALPDFAGLDPPSALLGRRLNPLPGTEREVEAVRAAFAPRPVELLTARAATEARVREALPSRRVIHFATHGIVDRRGAGLLAGLVLAPGPPPPRLEDDGFLQLFEIYGLKLDCDLAVLSACETSTGAFAEGEGHFALSRGFLVAGARRVVATLWPIDDESSAQLVGSFFRNTAASGGDRMLDPARSLRDAKREIRLGSGRSHPFFWAAFIITGVR